MELRERDRLAGTLRIRSKNCPNSPRRPRWKSWVRRISASNGPNPATYVGKGKLEEIQTYLNELNFDLVTFDDELLPGNSAISKRSWASAVLDRSALILDIFAQHARTREGAHAGRAGAIRIPACRA